MTGVPRRTILKSLLAFPMLAGVAATGGLSLLNAQQKISRTGGSKLKLSLNAYSFDAVLRSGALTLEGLLEFCAEQGFDGVDLTGYYFPGYPVVPADEFIYQIKKKAFLLGLDISGTGVKNDFTYTDAQKRSDDVRMVKEWIDVAAKLGAPVIRIFAGKQDTAGHSWNEVAGWMVKDIRECVVYGKLRGVIVAVQNHNDFIKTAEEALKIIEMVDSEWFGLILDTGSFRAADPYAEIAQAAPYAVNWQIKENIFVNGEQVKADIAKLVAVIRASGYRGYIPIETLGAGDPKVKVPAFLAEVRKALM